ncbi:MAG: DUF1295 domain-containing protein [Anaerolineales bacterium]
MIFPEWTTGNIILYGALAFLVIGVAPLELNGKAMMAYSKFRAARGIPARAGMFILYFMPIVALYFSAKDYISNATVIQWIVVLSVFIHFAKRVLETLFLHRYSGPIGLFTTLLIASFYSFASFLIGYLNRDPIASLDVWFYVGIVLLVVGMIGNFTHHKILADLRKNSLDYFIPKNGLFKYVVCPHYLFEIFTWTGIFLFSRHLGAALVLGFIVMYLSARSIRTLQWYKEKFADFPKNVKAMIPFVF